MPDYLHEGLGYGDTYFPMMFAMTSAHWYEHLFREFEEWEDTDGRGDA